MRFKLLFACLIAVFLWGRVGYADIFVWIDKDDVMHFTNENPPPNAKIFLQSREIPPTESDDPGAREAEWQPEGLQAQTHIPADELRFAEKQDELLQPFDKAQQHLDAVQPTQTVMGDQQNTLSEQQTAAQQLDTGADRGAEAAQKRTAALETPHVTIRSPRIIAVPHYRTATSNYRSPGRIFHYKSNQCRKTHHFFQRHHFNSLDDFHEQFLGSMHPQRGFHANFRNHRHDFHRWRDKHGGNLRFGHHSKGRTRFSEHPRHGGWRH